jgi:hypothetical protein
VDRRATVPELTRRRNTVPIKTTCGACGKQFAVKDEYGGKRVRCPGCGDVVKVSRPVQPAAPAPTGAGGKRDVPTPPAPESIEDVGLPLEFISDLGLKILYVHGVMNGYEIVEQIRLPYRNVVEHVIRRWRDQMLIQARSKGAVRDDATYEFTLTEDGRNYARSLFDVTSYCGPCPVKIDDYIAMMDVQTIRGVHVTDEDLQRAFAHLVLPPGFYSQIGPGINSGRSIFLYGPSGNGKSTVAEAIADMLGKPIYIPYAIAVGNEIITVYDDISHQPIEEQAEVEIGSWRKSRGRRGPIYVKPKQGQDARWVFCRRPAVIVGGELTMAGLDLQYNPVTKYYEAPFQLKANGGVFVIDDLGRQQIRPQDLLNRWIVPLERRIDYLTFHTGRKFEVPFDELIIFCTNLDPKDLVDEAFLRRIRYKVLLPNPSLEQFAEIFERDCNTRGIEFNPDAIVYLYEEFYRKRGYSLRGCHPRDILDQIIDIARFNGEEPVLTKDLVDQAWKSYFVEL